MEKKLSQRIKEQLASLRSRKKWQALAGVLSLLVLCWTVYALILPAVATTEAPDLTAKVTTATFQKSVSGAWVESDSFLSTDQARAQIEFAEVSTSDLASYQMCIKLPDGLDVSAFKGQSFDLSDSRYTAGKAGSYTLTDDGYALITFTEGYIAFIESQNSTIGGKLNFEFTWDMADVSAGDSVTKEIVMGQSMNKITITKVDTEEVSSGNYSLNKSGSDVAIDESGNGVITYTITLKLTNGMTDAIVLTDVIDIDGTYLQYGDFSIARADGNTVDAALKVTDGSAANEKTLTITPTNNAFNGGSEYVITYSVTLKGLATANWTLSADNAKNTISLTDNGETISKDTWTSIQKVNIKKSGELSTDSEGAYVMNWTILVNAGAVRNTLKGGETITDVLPDGLSIPNGTTVNIKVYDTSGNVVETRIATVSGGTISYTVPSGDAGKSYKYEFTYQTEITNPSSLPIGDTTYTNKATVNWEDGNPDESGASVTVSNKAIEKVLVSTGEKTSTVSGGFTMTHSWKSTITKSVSANDTYTDYTYYNQYNDTGYTLALTGDPVLTTESGTLTAGTDYTLTKGDGTQTYNNGTVIYQVVFLKEIKAPITITYNTLCTTTDKAINENWSSINVQNVAAVSIGGQTDSAQANHQIEITKDNSYNMIWKAVENASEGSSESSVTVDAEDRTIDWVIHLNKGGSLFADTDSVTVTDQIPDGQTYVEGSLKVTLYNNELVVTSEEVSAGGLITVVIPKTAKWQDGRSEDLTSATALQIEYQTEVTDEEYLAGSSLTTDVTNSATVKVNEKEYTSTHTVHFTRDVIGKYGTYDATTKTMTYSVLVNPDGADLLENGDQLRVCDILTDTGTISKDKFALAGVTLYKAVEDSNGNYVAGAYVQDMQLVSSSAASYANGTYTYDSDKLEINAYVPDGQAYMVVYAYRINVDLSATVSITNSATIYGADKEINSTKEESKVEKSEAGGYVYSSGVSLTLEKHDADSYTTLLSGATYTLSYYSGQNEWTEIGSYTTETNGQIPMTDSSGKIKVNRLFRLVETSAPEGYTLDATPYYFTVQENEDSDVAIPDEVKSAGYTVNFYNASSQTQAPITIHRYDKKDDNYVEAGAVKVSKLWTDSSGNAITDEETLASMPKITVQLCAKEVPQKKTYTVKIGHSGNYVTATVEEGGSIEWKVKTADEAPTVSPQVNIESLGAKTETIEHEGRSENESWSEEVTYYHYRISNIKQDLTVDVGQIAYYRYGGATIVGVKNPADDSTSTEPVTVVYDEQTLSASNNWAYTWDADAIKTYGTDKEYFVQEVASDDISTAYTTSYARYERDSAGNWTITSTGATGDPEKLQGALPSSGNGAWFKVTNQKKPEEGEKTTTTTTSLSLEKVWKEYTDGDGIDTVETVTRKTGSVGIKLWQIATVDGKVQAPVQYKNAAASDGLYTLSASNVDADNWKLTIADLPASETKTTTKDGTTTSTTTTYTYYVEEVSVDGKEIAGTITVAYADGDGKTIGKDSSAAGGTIVITNTEKKEKPEEYTLPNTGGAGTLPYGIGGVALALIAMLALARRTRKIG